MSDRPFLVTLVGGLNLALGALLLIGALLLHFVAGTSDPASLGWFDDGTLNDILKALNDGNIKWSTVCDVAAVIYGVLALLIIAVGYGLLSGWRIMWWVSIVMNAIGVVSAISTISKLNGSWEPIVYGVLQIVIDCAIIWYLMRPEVKSHFNI